MKVMMALDTFLLFSLLTTTPPPLLYDIVMTFEIAFNIALNSFFAVLHLLILFPSSPKKHPRMI
jgi:hypothetical protein